MTQRHRLFAEEKGWRRQPGTRRWKEGDGHHLFADTTGTMGLEEKPMVRSWSRTGDVRVYDDGRRKPWWAMDVERRPTSDANISLSPPKNIFFTVVFEVTGAKNGPAPSHPIPITNRL